MADVTRTVGSVSGGDDHDTIASALTWFKNSANYDRTGSDTRAIIELNEDREYTENNLVLNGFFGSPSSTKYLVIRAAAGLECKGKWQKARIKATGSAHLFNGTEDYIHIKNIALWQAGSTSSAEVQRLSEGSNDVLFEKCLIRVGSTSSQDGIYAGPFDCGPIKAFDCLFVMDGSSARVCVNAQIYTATTSTQTFNLEHCTFDVNGALAACMAWAQGSADSVTFNIDNCAAFDGNAADYYDYGVVGTRTWSGQGNIASDTSSQNRFGSTNNYNSVTLSDSDTSGSKYLVESISGFDYQLKEGANCTNTAIAAAIDPGSRDSRIDLTEDIAGNPRPTTFTDRDIGCFQVIDTSETSSGTPSITALTSSGNAAIVETSSGTPSITALTSTGTASVTATKTSSGSPSITALTSSGTSLPRRVASGAVTIAALVCAGTAAVSSTETASGSPSLSQVTSTGTAEVVKVSSGSPSISAVTSAGNANTIRVSSGTPSVGALTSGGTATSYAVLTSSGSPSIVALTSGGASTVKKIGSGSSVLDNVSSAGTSTSFAILTASGSPSVKAFLTMAAGASTATVKKIGSGSPSVGAVTSGGTSTIKKISSGAAVIGSLTSAGVSVSYSDLISSGSPQLTAITSTGSSIARRVASGAAALSALTSAGVSITVKVASGGATVTAITSSGSSEIRGAKTSSGASTLGAVTASGSSVIVKTSSGTPSIGAVTCAGTAVTYEVFSASGSITLDLLTSTGNSEVVKTATASPTITALTAAGSATRIVTASGGPTLEPIVGFIPGNDILYSDDLTQSQWTKVGVTIDADASGTMDRIVAGSGPIAHYVTTEVQNVGLVGQNYTLSAKVKSDGARFVTLSIADGADQWWSVTYDLSGEIITQEITEGIDSIVEASGLEVLGGGEYRIWATGAVTKDGDNTLWAYISLPGSGSFLPNYLGLDETLLVSKDDLFVGEVHVNDGGARPQFWGLRPTLDMPWVNIGLLATVDVTGIIHIPSSGSPSITALTSAGTAIGVQTQTASGSPSVTAITSAGTATQILPVAEGSPTINPLTSAGSGAVFALLTASGSPAIESLTSSGLTSLGLNAGGSAAISAITSTGAGTIVKIASGAPSIRVPMTMVAGPSTATVIKPGSGISAIPAVTSTGAAIVHRTAAGSPVVQAITSAGVLLGIAPSAIEIFADAYSVDIVVLTGVDITVDTSDYIDITALT